MLRHGVMHRRFLPPPIRQGSPGGRQASTELSQHLTEMRHTMQHRQVVGFQTVEALLIKSFVCGKEKILFYCKVKHNTSMIKNESPRADLMHKWIDCMASLLNLSSCKVP